MPSCCILVIHKLELKALHCSIYVSHVRPLPANDHELVTTRLQQHSHDVPALTTPSESIQILAQHAVPAAFSLKIRFYNALHMTIVFNKLGWALAQAKKTHPPLYPKCPFLLGVNLAPPYFRIWLYPRNGGLLAHFGSMIDYQLQQMVKQFAQHWIINNRQR